MAAAENIFGQLKSFTEAIAPVDHELAQLRETRARILEQAAESIGASILGQVITATRIGEVPGGYTIGAYGTANDSVALPFASPRRTYPGARRNYVLQNFFQNPDSATGRVVGLDLQRTALVLKPQVALKVSRYWVRLLGPDGEPLVSLNVH